MNETSTNSAGGDREADSRDEIERLRQRLALAETRIAELATANADLLARGVRPTPLGAPHSSPAENPASATALASLPLSIEMLRALADVVPQIIWANTAHGIACYFNQRWYDYTGLSFEQSAGPGWQAIVHPDDAPASNRLWRDALARGETFDAEYRLRRADGVYRWFIGRNVPLRNADNQVLGWFGTATDIQDLKQAHIAAQQSEQQFRHAIEHAPIPIMMWTENGDVLQINRAWSEITGCSPDEVHTLESWYAHMSIETSGHLRQKVRELFDGASTITAMPTDVLTRNCGRRQWLLSVSVPGRLPNGRRYAVGMAVDITEQRRTEAELASSQERLHLIVEGAVEHAIISMDLDRRITSWNTGAERMFGHPRDEIMGKMADVLFSEEDRKAGGPAKETAIALAQGRAADERWHVRKDGARFWASGVTLPLHERPGEPPNGFIKILRDETAQREAQLAVEASRKDLMAALHAADLARAEAETATRAKDQFLAVLSHELRTPLTPVLMAATTLSRHKDLPEPVLDALSMIRRNVQLEAQLVDDLLDVSRIVHGKLELLRIPMDMHEVVQRAIAVTQPELERKNQRLVAELNAERHHLTGDATRLQQVVWNLLGNASKFSPEGGQIQLRTYNEPGSLLIEVSDQGIGIEPQAAAKIFEAFAQANVGITREFGGLGLGLSISKATVAAHGGRLRAESAGPGQGAKFTVTLPLPSGE